LGASGRAITRRFFCWSNCLYSIIIQNFSALNIDIMIRLEHIGIAVKNLEESNSLFARLLGVEPYKMEEVTSEKVITSYFASGESKIELLTGTASDSPISKFIEKRGEGIHHLAFEVENIHDEMQRMKAEGFQLLNDDPKEGADGKLICFLHPKSTNGVLVELCQSINTKA
jgi:methylmalonyl-CoA/ethylmalonyl-CoA epimerase